jgi:glycosyltransferase involved in cell wall biosynthesis
VTEIGFNIDGFNGFVINEGVIQFKEKILKLLGDEKLLERMSRNSQQILRKIFQLNIKQLEAIYKSYN